MGHSDLDAIRAAKERGLHVDAGNAHRQSITLAPEDDDAHLQLGHVPKLQGRLQKAGEAYARFLELKPNRAAFDPQGLRKPGIWVDAELPVPGSSANAIFFEGAAAMRRAMSSSWRQGWRVNDFMEQLRATGFLGGRVRVPHDPSDGDIEMLYQNCLFTAFPSFVEGCGLPVGETLANGQVCVASNTSSVHARIVQYQPPDGRYGPRLRSGRGIDRQRLR